MTAARGNNLAFWRVPLLALAALLGVVGIAISAKLEFGSGHMAALTAVPWACAGACLTLAIADSIHHGRLNMARFQVILIGACAVVAHLFILYAVAGLAIVAVAWLAGSLISEIF